MKAFPADNDDGGYEEERDNDDGGDLCRICRSPEGPDDPLKNPCACRGSKYFHKECLRLWLNRHGNKQCEVCRRNYSFATVYSEKAPERLTCRDSPRGLSPRAVSDAAYVVPADNDDGGYKESFAAEESGEDDGGGDLCRICRSPEGPDDPLRNPCACRSSKYFHKECLRLWLDRHGNKLCEVCTRNYSFASVYSEKAPQTLTCRDSPRGLSPRAVRAASYVVPTDNDDGGYNQPFAAEESGEDDGGGDLCRICRSPEGPDDPLRNPCACRGSKYFHKECLRLWLDRHGNKHCEVCRRSYSFVPVYAEKAPEMLTCRDSPRGLSLRAVRAAAFPAVRADQNCFTVKSRTRASNLKAKINDTVRILSTCKVTELEKRKLEKRRMFYIEELKADLASFYGLDEFLTGYLVKMIRVPEIVGVFESFTVQLPVHICVNTIRIDKEDLKHLLENRRFILRDFKHLPEVFEVYEDTRPKYRPRMSIVETPELKKGYYTVKNASHFLPVLALNPLKSDVVLDMNADLGHSTAFIAARMGDAGVIYANRLRTRRPFNLGGQLRRMGVTNAVVSQHNEKALRNPTHDCVDLVLLHAPSSQSGIVEKVRNDGSLGVGYKRLSLKVGYKRLPLKVKAKAKAKAKVRKCVRLQKKLILSAIDLAKGGSGFIVYSTDSILTEENEAVIQYALEKRSVKLVQCNLNLGINGFSKYRKHRFDNSLKMAKRFYPHVHGINGLFVAKLEKTQVDDEENDDDEENV